MAVDDCSTSHEDRLGLLGLSTSAGSPVGWASLSWQPRLFGAVGWPIAPNGVWMPEMRILFVVAAMAFALSQISGCASIAAYQASHPYYKFPGSGAGGGNN